MQRSLKGSVFVMHQELEQLGQILKAKRQEKNLSLKEMENLTSIRTHFLAAIEEGDLSKLISPIYAQGFIKRYATCLELDGELLLKEHPTVMKLFSDSIQKPEFSYGIGSVEVRNTTTSEIKWLPNALVIAISGIALVSVWFLMRYLHIF